MRGIFRVVALSLGVALVSCGAGPKVPKAGAEPEAKLLDEVKPSKLLPELVGQRGVVAVEQGRRRVIVDRMRLVAGPDGTIERARSLFPGGSVSSVALPARLGGGYLFHVHAGGGTEVWRAKGWLDELRPLTRRNEVVSEVIPGFDRLYLRLSSGNRLIAVDPDKGTPMPLGPIPPAGSYGQLVFADGWRAVVDTDLRGPLATFDAGLTWRPLALQEKALAVAVIDGDPAVLVSGGRYLVDARGAVTRRPDVRAPRHLEVPADALKPPSPLGKRPLRAAVEDGWPDTATTAIVARGGALARVSLRDGRIIALAEDAYPEARGSCHAVRLGERGIGFVCGERDGATVVYEHAPPLGMKPVLRFDKPRFVASSGNGALVIRGRCAPAGGSPDDPDAHWYCVRSTAGAVREIRVKGYDLGVERLVGLRDGRVAVLVPPRGGSPGDLSIVTADGRTTKVALELPDGARELKRGLWLDGFEERASGALGGWVEAGGPVLGVEVSLDGKVKAGDVHEEATGAILGGRFAVLLTEGGSAFETSDGGMTFRSFDLPERDEEARAAPTRAVGPVGAALPGWVRIGWGEPATADDLKPVETPPLPSVPFRISPPLSLACEVVSVATPPLPDKPRPPAPDRYARPVRGPVYRAGPVPPLQHLATGWSPFRNTAPPPIGPEDFGVDNGSHHEGPSLRAYAWGKKGASFARAGRWLVRFDDRFDPAGGVRSTALSTPPWADEAAAIEGVGTGAYGSAHWTAFLDPSGRATLGSACRSGSGSGCTLYALSEGRPVLLIRDASGRSGTFMRPHGAVRLGETWLLLTQSSSNDVSLQRVDLGVARIIGTYHRPSARHGYEAPRLVRRALGGAAGILLGGAPEPGERYGSWYVLPVDPETGELGEAISLVGRDFSGPITQGVSRCAPEQDGWVFDMTPETPIVSVELANARAQIDLVEMRVRVDPGRACVESFAGRAGPFYALGPGAPAPKPITTPPGRKNAVTGATIPFAATEKDKHRRWGLSCRVKPPR